MGSPIEPSPMKPMRCAFSEPILRDGRFTMNNFTCDRNVRNQP
jgi:hypothetical protein